jgi:hypothetical protein
VCLSGKTATDSRHTGHGKLATKQEAGLKDETQSPTPGESIAMSESNSDRDAVLQDIAKFAIGKFPHVVIDGTQDGKLVVKAHTADKMLFLDVNWPPHPEINTQFTLTIMDRHEKRILVREDDPFVAGDQAKIAQIPWDAVTEHAAVLDELAQHVKIAKFDKREVEIGSADGTFIFSGDNTLAYRRKDLEWVIRKRPYRIAITGAGVLSVTVAGACGNYQLYFRAWRRHEPMTPPNVDK